MAKEADAAKTCAKEYETCSRKRHQTASMLNRCILLLFCLLLTRFLTIPLLSQVQDIRRSYLRTFSVLNIEKAEEEIAVTVGVRSDKFLKVPQIVWGLNNQKIALAKAALTARKLNRTLLMPNLSASLFYKETDLLQPIHFDHIFSFDHFNSQCHGFVQMARSSKEAADIFFVKKGNGRRWTASKDLAQLDECTNNPDIDKHTVIKLEGKHPFLWHDHWPMKDYATIFECLVLVDELSAEASRIVSKLREIGNSPTYVAVHMRIEKDWTIHCKKLETRAKIRDGMDLRICSSKEEIKRRVANIPGLEKPSVVYLAVADALLEDKTLVDGWSRDLVPYEKKKLGVVSTYAKYPYLIQSAIDYEVCLQADVFVGNSFSTFSSLIALQRTVRRNRAGPSNNDCEGSSMGTYAYNIEGPGGGPHRWATNMSDVSLEAISYGSNQVSCM